VETDQKPNLNKQPPNRLVSTYSNDSEIRDLVLEFVREMPHRVGLANHAFMRGDLLRLQFWAHQMKGGAGGYGFLEISDRAADLENTIITKQPAEQIFLALLRVTDLCDRASVD
jgi:HPt (histidine-containing phosphotransfer) domain-containing protein